MRPAVQPGPTGPTISDPNDQPILDAAITAAVDMILTGDKHFHKLALETAPLLTARAFLDTYRPDPADTAGASTI